MHLTLNILLICLPGVRHHVYVCVYVLLCWQAPYIEDPNTGVQMFESAEIIDYLKATYALYPSS
jgi:hypothetical protein